MKPVSLSFAEFRSCHLLLGIALALCFNRVSCTTNETDRLALLAFKAGIFEDPFRVLSSWNDSIGFCQWYGVICGRRHQRVTVLDLRSQGLFGSISPHIGNLSFLGEMWLQNNSFNQEIPPQLGGCAAYNELTGEIPRELGSLLKIREFALDRNNLTGSMPSSIGNLSSLEILFLSENNLSGSIPQVLGHLKNLQFIGFAANRVSGTIPSSLLNLSSLTQFDARSNQIQGTLPASIGLKLPDLADFSIFGNQLQGPIPPSISNCTKLDILQLGDNRFSGKVPSLENLYNLSWLQILRNQLGSGEPEDLNFLCSLTNNSKLRYVGISRNKFGGVLPICVGNLSSTLMAFDVRKNQISGKIPEEIGNFANVEVLYMNLNKLSGVIPSNLGNLRNLSKLLLSDNNLGGTIPSSLGNLSKLIYLFLDGNNFHGQIPPPLSNCLSLNWLDLSNNNLSGVIPSQLMSLSSLTIILNLSQNHLTGVLPPEVGNLRTLTALDISNNLLVGEIPSSLGDCTSLTSLRMGGNFFHGLIPQSIRSLGGIEELDLSCNNLSGQIPEFLTVFRSLKLLNLSYNNFEGVLPREGVFRNATGTSIFGNNKLCGGLSEFHLPNCISKSFKSRKINLVILSTSVILGVLGIALILAFVYLCWLKKTVMEPVSSSRDDSCPNVSYGTLLKATDGFSSTNLIGAGSFGSIYRGVLEVSETTVAVKVLHLVYHGALKSFNVEKRH
ncbi:probable LRR receptor-like serine/threonine-protein kinase At3g47570 [Eucalyptus grandis]|uniref:probable LRR receptor-like serine/threonine-protein kinase At3g47570 n=1 Tax=Eucalyptus grandis TaxID=71139 RepID=UPI00192E97D7|nr:probable LRR receptor-like serine/threonine-protein kinase At3g47570 [Eucalyptus grandis]